MAQESDIFLHEQVMSSDTQDGEKEEKTCNHVGIEQPVNYTRQVVYGLEDVPPWYATIAFGFQQFLASFGSIIAGQIIIGIKMCMSYNTVLMGRLMSAGFLICGIGTFLQSTFGCRLAIIQGSGSFFVAVVTILDLKDPCPLVMPGNATQEELDSADEEWRSRMLEIIIAIITTWILCVILTVADVFPDDPTNPAYNARTDIKQDALVATPWFLAPYPGM
ncbi:solute carrier family 23 member 2-like [Amphiura filiformis]|uniref:solute carrier family 23 member 2-like n=1 Tax=Amphiura filiformis TaxID=82378 RepID=UPI003B21E55A